MQGTDLSAVVGVGFVEVTAAGMTPVHLLTANRYSDMKNFKEQSMNENKITH